MNYATLIKTIKAYVENDFPTTVGSGSLTPTEQLNTFIALAEKRIYNEAQLVQFRKNQEGTMTSGTRFLTLPTDWMATFSLAIVIAATGAHVFLDNKDVSYIREAYPIPATTGTPAHYAIFDEDSLIIGPTPDAAYATHLHYFYYPESIVTASTTWLGDNFDQALLYGCLLEAYTFMKGEEDVIGLYKGQYDAAMVQLKMLGEGKNRQDMYRTEQVRYPVQ